MDYRCPICRMNLERRRLSHAIVARMEMDCSHCRNTIRLNVHRTETLVILLNFGSIVLLGALAYLYQSRELVVVTLATAMLGAAAVPLLERTWLRSWPRYAPLDKDRANQPPRQD